MREYAGEPDDGRAAVQSLDLRAANLTQELSQILDQTLAQTRVARASPGAAPAGTQFTKLVALVSSATQTQRSAPQPFSRDGLSSLSWTRPAQPVAPPPPPPTPVLAPPAPSLVAAPTAAFMPPMAPAASGLLVADPNDEEPMPIPSTWRQPTQADDDKWYRQQLGAAGLGLLAGLVVVVPAVLWLSGFLGGGTQARTARHQAEEGGVKVAEVKRHKVASAAAVVEAPVVVAPPPPAPVAEPDPPATQGRAIVVQPPPKVAAPVPMPKPVEPQRSRADDLLTQAKRRIEANDVPGARDILHTAPETATSAALLFLLAETYDPNMLASWQTRGVNANPERARSLYQKARDLGDSRAVQRLDWLMAN